VIHVKMAA